MAQYHKDPQKAAVSYRKWSLGARFGLTVEDYDALLLRQDGGCAICGRTDPGNSGHQKFLHIDHCHTTGKIRGLLCNNCNRGIGLFKDEPDRLMNAARYLAGSQA